MSSAYIALCTRCINYRGVEALGLCCAYPEAFLVQWSFSLNVFVGICHEGNKYPGFLKKQVTDLPEYGCGVVARQEHCFLTSPEDLQESWLTTPALVVEGHCAFSGSALHLFFPFPILQFPDNKYIVQDDFGEWTPQRYKQNRRGSFKKAKPKHKIARMF